MNRIVDIRGLQSHSRESLDLCAMVVMVLFLGYNGRKCRVGGKVIR